MTYFSTVALLAEGVDRNIMGLAVVRTDQTSPSSRRAWIEMTGNGHEPEYEYVALLAEGVDRNCFPLSLELGVLVALLAEGVDRNRKSLSCPRRRSGRPPRGGRG